MESDGKPLNLEGAYDLMKNSDINLLFQRIQNPTSNYRIIFQPWIIYILEWQKKVKTDLIICGNDPFCGILPSFHMFININLPLKMK